MIDLHRNIIKIDDKEERILVFEVWFSTPKGLIVKLEDAKKMCDELDWPIDVIRPVSIAISTTMWEVCP